MSTENQELKKVDARYNVEAAPIFSHAKPCINVSTTGQGLNNEVIRYDGDSLEAIRSEEFNVGQTSTPTEKKTETTKEKKTSRGRPRKFTQGEVLTTGNTNQVYSGNSSQIAHAQKKKKNMETYYC